MLEVDLKPHALDQLQIMVGRRRVGYVIAKIGAPINFLKKAQSGVELTDEQKTEIAEQVREKLGQHVRGVEAAAEKLRELISGGDSGAE